MLVNPDEKESKNLSNNRRIIINNNNVEIDEAKQEEENTVWKSFCFLVDKNALVFITQSVVIIITLIFSFYALYESEGDCSKSSPYFSLISFLVGKMLSTKF